VSARIRKLLVESAYRLDLSEAACVEELARAAAGAFDRCHPAAAFVTARSAGGGFDLRALVSGERGLADALKQTVSWIPAIKQREMSSGQPIFATSSQVFGLPQMKQLTAATGVPEFAGVICPTGLGVLVVGSSKSEPLRATAADQLQWLPIAAHLGAAWRLRNAMMVARDGDVSFLPSGRLVEEGERPVAGRARALLRRAVEDRERLRARDREAFWPALIAGRWTLVDRFESSGRRLVIACRNDSLAAPYQALSGTEAAVLHRALAGDAGKVLAADLRVSEATISRLIASSLRRLGLRDLSEAAALRSLHVSIFGVGHETTTIDIGVVSQRPADAPVSLDASARLTAGERDVLACVLEGHSHRAIAARRHSSPRTIANQVASIFKKLHVRSRRELIARVLGAC
jgi:DNA-binding NarL/FixJ family response regulator